VTLNASASVNIHGADGGPRPRIYSPDAFVFQVTNPSATVRHLEITRINSAAGTTLYLYGTAEDLIVRDTGAGASAACRLGNAAVIKNSVCRNDPNSGGRGILVYGADCSAACTPTVRNVTATANNPGGAALAIQSTSTHDATLTAVNTIFEGYVDTYVSGGFGGNATLNATYSFFHVQQTDGGGTITPSATNQFGYPLFVDFAAADYHQAPESSTTIDKGITDPANGATDYDGQARAQGVSTDIGADEFVAAAPGGGDGGGGGGPGGGGGGGAGGGGGGAKPPDPAIAAAKKPACLSIPGVVRDRTVKIKGGGKVVLSTRQLDDPAAPLRLSVKLVGGGSIRSAVFTANGKATSGTGRTTSVPVTALSIGSRRNKLKVTVTLASGKKVTVEQLAVVLRCSPPATTCKRLSDGRRLSCSSKTPLGGRRVKVTVIGSAGEKATGSATVTKGKYTVVVGSSSALGPGTYAYKAVVTTKRSGERFQMIRLVTVP
jgi:hypothetical protein